MKTQSQLDLTRFAFKMKLKPGFADEYQSDDMPLYGLSLARLLKKTGICDYSIFLDEETNTLFAVQKIDVSAGGSQDLGHHPIVKKWWAYMADIMETNADQSPVTIPLREVFYQE